MQVRDSWHSQVGEPNNTPFPSFFKQGTWGRETNTKRQRKDTGEQILTEVARGGPTRDLVFRPLGPRPEGLPNERRDDPLGDRPEDDLWKRNSLCQ